MKATHRTTSNNAIGLVYVFFIIAFTLFMASGLIPREKDNLDDFVQLSEWGVECEADGMSFTAYYVSEKPESLSFERGLCNYASKQFN